MQQPRAATLLPPLQRKPAAAQSETQQFFRLTRLRSVAYTPEPQRWPSQQPCTSTLALPNTPMAAQLESVRVQFVTRQLLPVMLTA
jgi:hypothetical protein